MKHYLQFGLLCSVLMAGSAFADEQHTVSLGYAQSKTSDFKALKGANLQYRYEFNDKWGVIGSATYLSGNEKDWDDGLREEIKLKYFSVLVGPSYRINEYVSPYALIGMSRIKASYHVYDSEFDESFSGNRTRNQFAYGVGVAINPKPNWAVNIGYEGTRFKGIDNDDDSSAFNGFNIGVGYRF